MGSIGVSPGAARLHLVDGVSVLRPEHQVFAAITTQVWVTWSRYTLDDHIRIGELLNTRAHQSHGPGNTRSPPAASQRRGPCGPGITARPRV
jgi:hypothetical protein